MNQFFRCLLVLLFLPVLLLTACGKAKTIVPSPVPTDIASVTSDPTATDIITQATEAPTPTPSPEPSKNPVISKKTDYTTQRWVVCEMTFTAANTYTMPVYDVTMDCVFTSPSGKKYTMPAFWDGDATWRVRFAPTEYGIWNYQTTGNVKDAGLIGKKGTMACNDYTGSLSVYKHGFVTTRYGYKYLTYDDGTPFFYLGDTHWGMLLEEFDSAGKSAGSIQTDSHFKYIVDKRVEQGFTVYQSEPIGCTYTLDNGISNADLKGFQQQDQYFQYIASKGLTHANATFPAHSNALVGKTDDKMAGIARYWVARYAAYPVMWTLSQEIDDDDFGKNFTVANNPYYKFCEMIAKYDPYLHPLTAHMESCPGSVTVTGVSGTKPSSFTNVTGHNWYAAQWKPALGGKQLDFAIPRDFWKSSKLTINYESKYDYLATKNYGARVEGWISFLNGMYGYGYGAQDIWYYNSTYSESTVTDADGLHDPVTVQDKTSTTWSVAMAFPTGDQMTIMRTFFEKLNWWKLIPDFNDGAYFLPASSACMYSAAHDGNNTIVAYLYGQDTASGLLLGLDQKATYTVKWFNPRTGAYTVVTTSMKATSRTGKLVYEIPAKPTAEDWVLLATKN